MLQLADTERCKWARYLILTWLVAYLAVTFLRLVQTLCILGFALLCLQAFFEFDPPWDHQSLEISNTPDRLEYDDEMLHDSRLEFENNLLTHGV